MAASILSTLLSSPQFTATNELLNAVVWQKLGIVDVEIADSAAVTDKPISNQQLSQVNGQYSISGSVYTSILTPDLEAVKIIQPTRLRVTALCDDLSTVVNIIGTFQDETATLSINTKSIITNSLCMTELDIDQTADMISAVKIVMVFEQAQPTESTGYAPAQAADSSLYGVSIQNPPSVVPLATLANAVSAATTTVNNAVSGALIDSTGGPFILDSSKLS